ncbi:MAG: hypothetical protein WBC33_12960, partial [Conexibacter sp.]
MKCATLLAAGALLLAALEPASAAVAATAGSCKAAKPAQLRLSRALGRSVAMLRWQVPKQRRATYRVLRDGRVVGQTRRAAM